MEAQPEEEERFSKIKEAMSKDPAAAVEKIKEELDKKLNTPLNIAITGESGSGKSSFVNALRGIKNHAEGAAQTGCVETTMEVKAYPHPNHPNVILWDLPGVGTTKFPADKYLEHVGFEKFDFFIIISDTRFRENDTKLALEIQKMEKKFYFVRSKIDNDLSAEERNFQGDFDEEKILKVIREDCIKGLCQLGIEAPQVFLVSSFELHRFDFHQFQEFLEKELPEHRRFALLVAMPNINLEIIEKKREAFQRQIKHQAAWYSFGAATPILGVYMGLEEGILVTALQKYITGFGLDKSSLERLSVISGVPLKDLQAVIKSDLCRGPITTELVIEQISQSTPETNVAVKVLSWIPLIGTPAAMSLSYVGTSKALNAFLQIIADDAHRVFRKALGLRNSV